MPPIVAAAGLAGRFQEILDQFGIEWKSLVMQIISFSILAFVLYRFLLKPVLATMGDRQKQIDAGLRYAEEMKAKLALAQQESVTIIKQAQTEGARLVDETRRTAKEFLDAQQKDATARANDMITKAQQAIDLEHKKELRDPARARYNQAATRELTEIKD
jgi:F-type H+-transporting ATPase subunit b